MAVDRVGVLGATSLVADELLSLLEGRYTVVPLSRRATRNSNDREGAVVPYWISLIPIWALPGYFEMLSDCGARRVIALSSTSLFGRKESKARAERELAARLAAAERSFLAWAESRAVEAVILRPTLIYGRGRDRNISEIARFVRRFGFFPIAGAANGLRQPIHAADVASACRSALEAKQLPRQSYNIAGGETLTYREMVVRVFHALGARPRLIAIPAWLLAAGIALICRWPRFRHWSVGMAARMNQDLVFDSTAAKLDLNFSPRPFHLEPRDLPA